MYKEVQKEKFISYYLRSRVIGENTIRDSLMEIMVIP